MLFRSVVRNIHERNLHSVHISTNTRLDGVDKSLDRLDSHRIRAINRLLVKKAELPRTNLHYHDVPFPIVLTSKLVRIAVFDRHRPLLDL